MKVSRALKAMKKAARVTRELRVSRALAAKVSNAKRQKERNTRRLKARKNTRLTA